MYRLPEMLRLGSLRRGPAPQAPARRRDRRKPGNAGIVRSRPGIRSAAGRDLAGPAGGQTDALIASCLSTPLAPRAAIIQDILRLGIAQLLFLRTPPHAAVATSVDLAHGRGFLSDKGLVNAVLRRLSVEGPERIAAQDAARLNTPAWLWRSWMLAYGETTTRAIANAHLKEAPLDLSVREDREEWCSKLQGTLLPTGTLRRPAGGAVTSLPGYAEGAWWVQDAAAALPAMLFGEMRGLNLVDLCAAPGGKTNSPPPAPASPRSLGVRTWRQRASTPGLLISIRSPGMAARPTRSAR